MGTQDRLNVINNQELKNIYGGLKITATFVSYATKAFNSILDIGRSLGSAMRRIRNKKLCSL